GPLERDELAIRFTTVGASGRGRPKRPSGRGGDRRLDARQAYAGDLVAIGVHLGDEDRISRPSCNRWRVVRQDAAIEIRPDVEDVAGRDHTRVVDARDARPAEVRLRHESYLRARDRHCKHPVPALRYLALRRLGAVAHPSVERDEERAMCAVRADWIE